MKAERRPLRLVAPLVLAALVAGSAVPGCYGATEIQVQVTTNVSCLPGASVTTQIFTGPTGTVDFGTAAAAETDRCVPEEPRVGTLSVVPTGARDDQFDLEVVGAVGIPIANCRAIMLGGAPVAPPAVPMTTGCIVARRRVSFRPHKSLTMPIRLDKSCIGVACTGDQTCDVGFCAPTSSCDETGCPRERVSTPAPDMDGSSDAPDPADAAPDAPALDASKAACAATPSLVVEKQAIVGQLALQGADFVYLNKTATGAPEIRRLPRDGSAGPKTVLAATALPSGATLGAVTADATRLAWTEESGGGTSLFVSAGGTFASGTALNRDQVTIAFSSSLVAGFGRSGFVRSGGAGMTTAFTYAQATSGVESASAALAAGVPEILVDDQGAFYGVSGSSTVVRYLVNPGTNVPLEFGRVTVISAVRPDIALAGHAIYVAGSRAQSQGIFRIDRALVDPSFNDEAWFAVPLADLPRSMTSDGVSLYYAAGAKIARIDLAAVTPMATTVASIAAGTTADRLQVDSECIYWVEDGARIMRRLK